MGSLKQFRQEFLAALAQESTLMEYTFMEEYPAIQPAPISAPVITVGLQEISLPGSPLNQLYSQVSELTGSVQAREAEIKAALSIYVPQEQGSGRCYHIFSDICDILLFSGGYDAAGMKAGKLQFDRNLDAYTLDAVIAFTAMLMREEG